MASSLVKIDIHLIFHVKSTGVTMRENDLPRIFQYIGGIIREMNAIPMEIGGMKDHVHIFTSLPKTVALTDFVRDIKANSSRWIKQIDHYYAPFAWQDGYGAFSVSPSLSEKTVNYIRNQKEHHRKRSFREEYKLFLDAYGIDYDEKYAFSD
ncbi:MAG: transposase [Prevotella sp.]|jgi:REP element-mobilizing transposase RayT|nr:transposase [Prevotella sp.]MBR6187832.1 transposase [Prevotella sp.]